MDNRIRCGLCNAPFEPHHQIQEVLGGQYHTGCAEQAGQVMGSIRDLIKLANIKNIEILAIYAPDAFKGMRSFDETSRIYGVDVHNTKDYKTVIIGNDKAK